MREVMTPEQVAEYLQLNKDTVYRLIRQRKLAATRIGRAYRIVKEDLEAFLSTYSTRAEVRDVLFRRVEQIAARNRNLDGDELLEELEQLDEDRRSRAKSA